MQRVHEKYPLDEDIAAMYAEAVMNLSPWDVFETNHSTGEVGMNMNSQRAFSVLSKSLYPSEPSPLSLAQVTSLGTSGASRDHPLMLHLWIHLLESGPLLYVQAAERQADLLWSLSAEPSGRKLGHLLHM